MAEEGIGLKYKLLAFMLAISIIPLSAVSFMAITNSRSMGDEAVDNTEAMGQSAINDAESMGDSAMKSAREMGNESISSLDQTKKSILNDLTEMENETISKTEDNLINVVKRSLFSKTNSTADKISTYMTNRIDNILSLKTVKDTEEAYWYYSNSHVGQIYSPGLAHTEENLVNDVPMFRGIYRIKNDGNISFKVGYSPDDYSDFDNDDWKQITTMDVNETVYDYPSEQPSNEKYDPQYIDYALRNAYEELSENPQEYRNKVYFPEVNVNIGDNENRTTNLLMTSTPSPYFTNGVWMGATPVFDSSGNFDGMVVANINHLHVMKLNFDFRYREDSFATLSQLNDKTKNIKLQAGQTFWDTYNDDGGEITATKKLPDGTTVHYNDVMENQKVGITVVTPNVGNINDVDTTVQNDGAPIFAYLGNEMHRGRDGILVYNTMMGAKWAAYNSVDITSDKTTNLNDLSLFCNANRQMFLDPVEEISSLIDEGIKETRDQTSKTIDELNGTLSNEINNLESDISSSKESIKSDMSDKKEDTTQEIDSSVDQLQNTVIISVVVILALVAVSAYVIADRIVSPIKELTDIADRVSQGEMDLAVEVEAKDEIGELAESFNRMINSLKIAMEQLEEEM